MGENRWFIKKLTGLSLPLILQNLLSAGIGMADTFMLSCVGQDALSAVALANQLQFVLSLFFMGLTSSTGIMMAQYLGKKDLPAVSHIFTVALKMAVVISLFFAAASVCVPGFIMRIFTNSAELIHLGGGYLRIVGITYLFSAFSQIYLAALKAMHKTAKSMKIAGFTLVANVFLNAVFIFGLFGAPRLGIQGVAIATVISRTMEMLVCAFDMIHTRRVCFVKICGNQPKRDFMRVTLPYTAQGLVWGGAMAVFSAIMGHLGSDIVAANSAASSVQNIATVVCFGFAEGGSILLSNDLGAGYLKRAKDHSRWLLKAAVLSGILGCVIMLSAEPVVRSVLNFTPGAMDHFVVMYRILSVNVIFAAITNTMLSGIFPSGGDTRYGLYIDGAVMWGFCVMLGSFGAFVLGLPPIMVFILLNVDELVKTPFVILRYRKDKWLNNLTKQEE